MHISYGIIRIRSRKSIFFVVAVIAAVIAVGIWTTTLVMASPTSSFTQTVTAGTLSVDVVDGSYVTVASPAVAMSGTSFSFACQTATGTFGTATEQIYVQNPDAADNGWSMTFAASAPTDFWNSAGTDFDFNDGAGAPAGCADGADADALIGQMTVDPSGGTLATGQCASCTTTSVTKGSSAAFEQGSVDSITILTGAAGSDDIGDWTLQGVSISQQIPAEQPAASDYSINLTLSIIAT